MKEAVFPGSSVSACDRRGDGRDGERDDESGGGDGGACGAVDDAGGGADDAGGDAAGAAWGGGGAAAPALRGGVPRCDGTGDRATGSPRCATSSSDTRGC